MIETERPALFYDHGKLSLDFSEMNVVSNRPTEHFISVLNLASKGLSER
jgi:hypothetical protein